MVTLTDEQKQQLVDAAVEDIRKKSIDAAVMNLSSWVRNVVAETIHAEILTLVKEEIVPAVKEELIAKKPVLVEAAVLAAGAMATQLAEAMSKRLAEKLSQNYHAGQIFKQMFD